MWKRCWWATWVSGFFGVTGMVHFLRVLFPFKLVVGSYEVPRTLTALVGSICFAVSAGLLWLEWIREKGRSKTHEISKPKEDIRGNSCCGLCSANK